MCRNLKPTSTRSFARDFLPECNETRAHLPEGEEKGNFVPSANNELSCMTQAIISYGTRSFTSKHFMNAGQVGNGIYQKICSFAAKLSTLVCISTAHYVPPTAEAPAAASANTVSSTRALPLGSETSDTLFCDTGNLFSGCLSHRYPLTISHAGATRGRLRMRAAIALSVFDFNATTCVVRGDNTV